MTEQNPTPRTEAGRDLRDWLVRNDAMTEMAANRDISAIEAEAAAAPATPEPAVRCGNCGADLSNYPTAATGHVCPTPADREAQVAAIARILHSDVCDCNGRNEPGCHLRSGVAAIRAERLHARGLRVVRDAGLGTREAGSADLRAALDEYDEWAADTTGLPESGEAIRNAVFEAARRSVRVPLIPECVADGSHSDDLSHAAELRNRTGRHATPEADRGR